MSAVFWTSFFASLLAAFTTTCGIWFIRQKEHWARQNMVYFMCFAASLAISARVPAYWLSGFLAFYLFNWFFTAYVCERGKKPAARIGWIPLCGIGLHSFLDGFIYSIGFSVSVPTGILATTGMVLHEFPEGIVTYLLLLRGGFAPRKAFVATFLAAALSTPVGMLVSYPFIRQIRGEPLGDLLALSAGALIYVGASHLLPETEEIERKKYNLFAFLCGVIITIGGKILHH
jgi:zinc transporter ZupT